MTPHDMNQGLHLDAHFNAIRQKFDGLAQELDEARNERDEYKRNYTNQAKELQELRQKVLTASNNQIVCQHCKSCQTTDDNLLPPVSESYFSVDEGEGSRGDNVQETRKDSIDLLMRPDKTYFPQPDDPGVTYHVESNLDSKVALKLSLVHTLTQNASRTSAAFSPDGKCLATASREGEVQIFDAKTDKRISVMRDLYKSGEDKARTETWCLGFSPDGKLLATGDSHGEVKIWIVSQKRVRNTFNHPHTIWGLDFSPNGQSIAIACGTGVVILRLRDGFSRILQQSPGDHPFCVRYSQDGRSVASGGHRGGITLFNGRTGKLLARHKGHIDNVWGIVFTPDGKGLISASWDKMVIHWDVSWLKSTYDSLREDVSTQDSAECLREHSRFVGHEDYVFAISISPDGNWIASGSRDETVRIWDAHTTTLRCILHGHGDAESVDFSRSGDYLVVADDRKVTVWNYTKLLE